MDQKKSYMLQHLFIVSIRYLKRSRSNTIINIAGLAVSLASFIFIALYIIDESTYDTMHPHAAQTYRISQSYHSFGTGAEQNDARAPGLWAVELKNTMPEILHYTRMSRFGYPGTVQNEKHNQFNVEAQFFWVDSTYTNIFSLPMISGGDPQTILKKPHQVIINEQTASKYFGKEDPIGQSIIYSRDGMDIPLVVAGIMKDYPSNVHFHPNFITSNLALAPLWNKKGEINSSYSNGSDRINSWSDSFTYSYIELKEGTDPIKVDRVLRQILKTNLGEDAKYVWPTIVKLTDLHFRSGMLIELESPGDPIYLYVFGSIGILILLIACINYMNMATAKSMQRSKEVGLRKTLGVRRRSLVFQFMGESILLTCISMVLALILVVIFLPGFQKLTSCTTTLQQLLTSRNFFLAIALICVVGLISGSYPSFFLSGFKPLDVLKGRIPGGGAADTFRKTLVIFQFTITLILIVGTIVIQQQLSFVNVAKLSEYKNQIMAVRFHGLGTPRLLKSFEDKIRHKSSVEAITAGADIPIHDRAPTDQVKLRINSIIYLWDAIDMDFNFPKLFNLKFIGGRDFSARNPADSNAVIINQSALNDLHMTLENVMGLQLVTESTQEKKTVIGVVKDFNVASLRRRIQPLIISASSRDPEVVYVKLAGNNFSDATESLEKIWKETFPAAPFAHWFLDKSFDQIYQQEKRTNTLFTYFASLAIFIGCLGLFGLTSFTVEQRTKEIGIRKVLGATGMQIMVLIQGRFIKLILISVMIGLPLSVFLMNSWLSRFAYQTKIGWVVLMISAGSLLMLTCITVAMEAVKAVLKNPGDAIRYE